MEMGVIIQSICVSYQTGTCGTHHARILEVITQGIWWLFCMGYDSHHTRDVVATMWLLYKEYGGYPARAIVDVIQGI